MIFQLELSTLDSELSQLQALLSAKQQQRNLYNQLQQQTEGYLVGLAKLKNQIAETVGGSAIASLKSAVLDLFDPGDHGGNQPIAPTPDDDPAPEADQEDDDFDIIALNGETGDCLTTDDLDDIDDTSTTKLTYAQAIKRRCGACWGYEVTSKADIKSGFINRTDLGFMATVNLERTGKEFYETVEAYLNKLYYNGQACEFASILELDKPLVVGDRFWFGAVSNTGTVIKTLAADEYLCQIDGAVGEVQLERGRLHYIPSCLEGQSCDIDKAPLTGQSCMWATPFASSLTCLLWEDAPLKGQYCTITLSDTEDNKYKSTKEGEAMPYVEFVEVTDKVGYLKVTHSGEIKATYAGFTRKDRAEAWGRLLAMTYNIASGFEVRPAKHLPFKWELKLWDMSINQIQKLAAEDLTKSPRVEANSLKPSFKTESPAQETGIEPPAGWRQVQPQEQPTIAPGALVRHCVDAKFNIFQYGILQEASESSAEVWFEQDGTSKKVALASLNLIASDPQYAKVLDSKSEWLNQTFVVIQVSKAGLGYSLLTPKGVIWFREDGVSIVEAETEEVTPASEPEQAELPIYQRSDGGFQVEQIVRENASILEVCDVVEITGDRHPQHFGLVGTVEALSSFSELPISVRTPRGLKGYLRSDLKLISKAETAPKRQGLQSGQMLMGDRIATTGAYTGLARQNAINNAQLGTADKLAALELVKAGMPPEKAWAAVKGEQEELDF